MKLVIQTQIHENYGAHDWDGTGECPQYWKAKGGTEYIIDMNESSEARANAKAYTLAMELASRFSCNNNHWREWMIDFSVQEDDYQPRYEKLQLEYEGRVIYPCPRYTLAAAMALKDGEGC